MEKFMSEVSEQQRMTLGLGRSSELRKALFNSKLISLLCHPSFSQVRDKMNLKVNAICAPERSYSADAATQNINNLK